MQSGPAAAAATLNDPKADHLGCAALPRNRIGSVVDRVTLAGRAYDCAAVKDTTVCHWMDAGALPGGGPRAGASGSGGSGWESNPPYAVGVPLVLKTRRATRPRSPPPTGLFAAGGRVKDARGRRRQWDAGDPNAP